ncbi:MAG TPA: hypothetical protein VKN99_24460, partial [Polyangia bacterium]|nr:hypothetical protein [Polyangia bacterium]
GIAYDPAPTRSDRPFDVTIDAIDLDGDSIQVSWSLTDPQGMATPGREARVHVSPHSQPGNWNLDGEAVDEPGASTPFHAVILVPNLAPHIDRITVNPPPGSGNYALLTELQLYVPREKSATTWDDDDPYERETISWRLSAKPVGSAVTGLGPCQQDFGNEFRNNCFVADAAGRYEVEVAFQDPYGQTGSQHTAVMVDPDRPPCIAAAVPTASTELLIADLGTATRLQVTRVDDDLDPYPAGVHGVTQFRWSTKRASDAAFVALEGYDQPLLDLDPSYAPGERVQVRVQAVDRDPTHTLSCPVNQRECDFVSSCAGWVTWEIEYR